jgi:hypothetical protein
LGTFSSNNITNDLLGNCSSSWFSPRPCERIVGQVKGTGWLQSCGWHTHFLFCHFDAVLAEQSIQENEEKRKKA